MNEKAKKLSISIVIYQNYDEVLTAIHTLEKYTPESFQKEIFLIDNGAHEDMAFLRAISVYKDIKYIKAKKNLGFGKAHNYILKHASSEYHCIMNPDIVFLEDAFTPILEYMDENSDVGMVIPNVIDGSGKRQKAYREELTVFDMFVRMFCPHFFKKRDYRQTLQYKDYSKPFHVPFGQGCFLVIRTDLFRELKGFDESFFMYLEDADLCRRVNKVSKLMYFPGATVIHKWKQGSHKSLRLFSYHFRSMIYYFKKWGVKWW